MNHRAIATAIRAGMAVDRLLEQSPGDAYSAAVPQGLLVSKCPCGDFPFALACTSQYGRPSLRCRCGEWSLCVKLDNHQRGAVMRELHNLMVAEVRARVLAELRMHSPLRWTVHASSCGRWWRAHGRRGRRSPWRIAIDYTNGVMWWGANLRHGDGYTNAVDSIRAALDDAVCCEVLQQRHATPPELGKLQPYQLLPLPDTRCPRCDQGAQFGLIPAIIGQNVPSFILCRCGQVGQVGVGAVPTAEAEPKI